MKTHLFEQLSEDDSVGDEMFSILEIRVLVRTTRGLRVGRTIFSFVLRFFFFANIGWQLGQYQSPLGTCCWPKHVKEVLKWWNDRDTLRGGVRQDIWWPPSQQSHNNIVSSSPFFRHNRHFERLIDFDHMTQRSRVERCRKICETEVHWTREVSHRSSCRDDTRFLSPFESSPAFESLAAPSGDMKIQRLL